MFFIIVLTILFPLHFHSFYFTFYGHTYSLSKTKTEQQQENKSKWNFARTCTESVYQFGEYCRLNKSKSLGFPGGSVVKNLPAKARDVGSIPGMGRSPRKGNDSLASSSILAWEIPWTEGPGGLQSMGSQRVRQD